MSDLPTGFTTIRIVDTSARDGGWQASPPVLVSRAMIAPGPPDGIPWDDQAHLAQLAARNREARIGFVVFWALAIVACLIFWGALIDELLIHLGK